MVSFTRTLQCQVTETGKHYVLSIPREIAHALGLGAGGLCSIELKGESYKFNTHKKRPVSQAVLKAYKDAQPTYTAVFDPSKYLDHNQPSIFVDVPMPPRTRGPSRHWGQGRIDYHPGIIRELRAARLFLEAEIKRIWPRRRGPKRKRRR